MAQIGPYQPGPPLPGYVVPQTPPPRKSRTGWIAGGICAAVVLAGGCFWGIGRGVSALMDRADAVASSEPLDDGSGRPLRPRPDSPDETEDPAATRPSTYDVRSRQDLDRVCDRWFYPNSPKHSSTKAPHPILFSARERNDETGRRTRLPSYEYDEPQALQKAWRGYDKPSTVQLVACIDLDTVGKTVKSCEMDDPRASLKLKRATYQVVLYEVATRRKLFEKKVTGEDEECPSSVYIRRDNELYTVLNDRQLAETVRRFVEK